jgi:hypothetical protein
MPPSTRENLDFRVQINASRCLHFRLQQGNQIQYVPRRRATVIDDEISVLLRDYRPADASAFEAKLIN